MNDVLLWALKLVLGALVLMPFAGGIGFALIDRWWTDRLKFEESYAAARAEALRSAAEQMQKMTREKDEKAG